MSEVQAEPIVTIRFTERRIVDDYRKGTDDEERYEEGEVVEVSPTAAAHWCSRKAAELVTLDGDGNVQEVDEPKSLGGNWYLMPDGSKVRGKAAAGLA